MRDILLKDISGIKIYLRDISFKKIYQGRGKIADLF
jgi:hypothetical protein